jgi:hypothetical protein
MYAPFPAIAFLIPNRERMKNAIKAKQYNAAASDSAALTSLDGTARAAPIIPSGAFDWQNHSSTPILADTSSLLLW